MATKKKATKATKKPAAKKTAAKKTAKPAKKAPKKAATKKAAKTAKPAAKKTTTTAKKATVTAPAKKTAPPAAKSAEGAAGVTERMMAPNFKLPSDDGKVYELSSFTGKRVVLYFYPRDDTPGCTVQACDFRDRMDRLQQAGVVVLGVSKDSVASHQRFRNKFNLTFPLLSDEDLDVHRLYGTWGTKQMYGKPVQGTIRSTFLIGADGAVQRVWRSVKTQGHADDVLAAL
jgi:thioredoxin-dependent peroxiredoxin